MQTNDEINDGEFEELILKHGNRITAVALAIACANLAEETRKTKEEIQEKIVMTAIELVLTNSEADTLKFIRANFPTRKKTDEN